MSKKGDGGYILIVVLLLLLVLTVIGLAAIGTSSIENILSGNIRLKERNVSKADAGAEISRAIIERTVREQDTQGFANIVNDVNLPTELRSTSFDPDTNDDVIFAVSGQNVTVDIDKMYVKWMGGTAIEFAAGYEGVGKSGGSGFYTFFKINSAGADLVNSVANVGTIYRYVPK
jgi:Tfp pilus assembly protein PilX